MKSRLTVPLPDGTLPKPSFATLLLMSSTSGVLGGIAGNPADVINVRMQQDRSLPVAQRRGYKHAIDGLIRMAQSEGASSLFRGVGPNCVRAALMTASQLATYDQAKSLLLRFTPMEDGVVAHIAASLGSGLVV
jgi:dicarboxylate transporter 10